MSIYEDDTYVVASYISSLNGDTSVHSLHARSIGRDRALPQVVRCAPFLGEVRSQLIVAYPDIFARAAEIVAARTRLICAFCEKEFQPRTLRGRNPDSGHQRNDGTAKQAFCSRRCRLDASLKRLREAGY